MSRIARLAVLSLVSGLLASPGPAEAEPIDPDRAIHAAQRRILRQKDDARAYLRLGDAYIQKARASGDMGYYTRAEQALRKSIDLAPSVAGAWRHLAHVCSARHEFLDAATHAARAIELDPDDADAHGVLGDAWLEIGRYDDAATAYRTMVRLNGNLSGYARLSGLKSVRGDPEGAIADLTLAVRLGQANGDPKESVAWAQWQLGNEHFDRGNLTAAAAMYEAALATFPGYYRALAGTARVHAARGRLQDAADLYRRALAIVPLLEYVAALGDVYHELGRREDATTQYQLVEYIAALDAVNKVIHNRELAYFYADHDRALDRALALAQQELTVRKDVYGFDVLAWTLYKKNRLAEARTAIAQALAVGTKDARLFFHAGMIYAALDERAEARRYLGLALATNPYFHRAQAAIARRTLQELGSHERATP